MPAELVEVQHAVDEPVLDEVIAVNENNEDGNTNDNLESQEVAAQEEDMSNGAIVMVLRKTLYWPAKIVSSNGKLFEVMIFDKARTTEMKQQKFILPFTADMAACEGRGAVWVKAWKEGKEEYESRKY